MASLPHQSSVIQKLLTPYEVLSNPEEDFTQETDVEADQTVTRTKWHHEPTLSGTTRPCYYMLRGLGIWQPDDCSVFFKVYNCFGYLILIAVLIAIMALSYVHNRSFECTELLNNIMTVITVSCPFIFTKYYFYFGNYEALVRNITQLPGVSALARKLSIAYSCFSMVLWCLSVVFFYVHWRPFFNSFFEHALYGVTAFFAMGYWTSWLSIYGFVCHLHKAQIVNFKSGMVAEFKKTHSVMAERKSLANLTNKLNDLLSCLGQTQKDFSQIISIAVGYHIVDMVIFSIAYWTDSFGKTYPMWQYAGTLAYDVMSIFIKLYPASVVCLHLHKTMVAVGAQCRPRFPQADIPKDRFGFYTYIYLREQDAGFRILGVKITLRLTVGLFVTMLTVAAAFLKLTLALRSGQRPLLP